MRRQKHAFWGAALKGVGGAAASAAKGMFGFGDAGFGFKPLNWAANAGAKVYSQAAPLVNTVAGTGLASGFSINNPFTGSPLLGGGGRTSYASDASTGSAILDNFTKEALHMSPSDLVDAAAYAAFAGSKFVDPHEHPVLHTALDAGALAALAGTTGYGMLTGKDDYKPGMKDLVGLGLMGSALYDRAKSH